MNLVQFNDNATLVTALYNLKREKWINYKRDWNDYLVFFRNTLMIRGNFCVFVEPELEDFAITTRKLVDPGLHRTKIYPVPFNKIPAYKYWHRMKEVMDNPSFQEGLVLPDVPEVCQPDYSVLIHSKTGFISDAIADNPFHHRYFVWLDAGICHQHFRAEYLLKPYPNDEKIKVIEDNKVHLLCRSAPEASDLNMAKFFKSHTNRFGAACVPGKKEAHLAFHEATNQILEEALSKELLDSEQSIWAVCYLRHPHLIAPYMGDWYDNFLRLY